MRLSELLLKSRTFIAVNSMPLKTSSQVTSSISTLRMFLYRRRQTSRITVRHLDCKSNNDFEITLSLDNKGVYMFCLKTVLRFFAKVLLLQEYFCNLKG